MRIAHLAFDLGLGRQRRYRVDHHHVYRPRAHQHVGNLERLLAGIRLRHQQVVDLHAELLRVGRIERVLGIDEGSGAAELLRLGDRLQRQGRLARGFRPIDLDHPSPRQAADTERNVQAQ